MAHDNNLGETAYEVYREGMARLNKPLMPWPYLTPQHKAVWRGVVQGLADVNVCQLCGEENKNGDGD